MTQATSVRWHPVARLEDLVEDEAHPVEVGNTLIALVRCGDRVHGVSNVCSHDFALLSDGIVEDGCIECPLHQARFDVATGERLAGPDCEAIRIYPTRLEPDGTVSVECD